MSDFFTGVQGVMTILLIIAVGYILGRRKWFSDDCVKAMSRLVLQIALPPMLFTSILSAFTRDDISRVGSSIVLPLISVFVLYCLSAVVAVICRIPESRRGVFRACFAFSNTVFVGIPVNIALFGEHAAPYVTLYYLGNTTLFWTIGVYFIRRDNARERFPVFSWKTLGQIFSPPMAASFIAVFLVMNSLSLPVFVMSSLKYIAGLTTPLAILIIGITLKPESLRRINPEIVLVLIARFILAPGLILFLLGWTEFPDLMRKVFIMTAAMPVMTQIPLIAKAYGADYETAGIAATVTTTISLIAIPVYMVLLGG